MQIKWCKMHNGGMGAMLPIDDFYPRKGICKRCEKARKRALWQAEYHTIDPEVVNFQKILNQPWRKNNALYSTDNITYYGHWD